jgi:hypothetical protein
MEIIRKKLNKSCMFHWVNQWDEKLTKMMCTIYFWFINAKYNWVIKLFTEDNIKEVAKTQFNKWLFSYKNWGKLSDWIKAVFGWLNDNWYDCNLWNTKKDSEVKDWLNRWYAIWLWIYVNKTFYNDKLDWSLDLEDYNKYKGTIWHATNLIKWTCRWKFDCESNWKEMFLGSYFSKGSTYKCNIDKVLENIDMDTKYCIY